MLAINWLKQAADDQHEAKDGQGDAHDRADQGHREDDAHDHEDQAEDRADQPAGGFDDPYDQSPDQPEGVEQPVHAFFVMFCHFDLHLNIRHACRKVAKSANQFPILGLTTNIESGIIFVAWNSGEMER